MAVQPVPKLAHHHFCLLAWRLNSECEKTNCGLTGGHVRVCFSWPSAASWVSLIFLSNAPRERKCARLEKKEKPWTPPLTAENRSGCSEKPPSNDRSYKGGLFLAEADSLRSPNWLGKFQMSFQMWSGSCAPMLGWAPGSLDGFSQSNPHQPVDLYAAEVKQARERRNTTEWIPDRSIIANEAKRI